MKSSILPSFIVRITICTALRSLRVTKREVSEKERDGMTLVVVTKATEKFLQRVGRPRL